MSWPRIAALAGRIIIQFRRDRRTLGLLIFVPMFVLTLMALLFRAEPSKIPIGVASDGGMAFGGISLAGQLTQTLTQNAQFQVVELRPEEIVPQLRTGKIKAGLVFPSDFIQRLQSTQPATIKLTLEGSNPQDNAAVIANLNRALSTAMLRLLGPASGQANPLASPIQINTDYLYGGKEFDNLDYFAPVIVGLFAFFFVYLLTSVSFFRERTQGTMERLMASPLTRAEIILGYMLGFSFFAIVQSLAILLFAIFALRVHYVGNVLIVFLVVAILTIGSVNIGIFLSAFAKNELQAVQFIPLIIVPQALLGGVFWPVESMPQVLQWSSYIMPLTYANNALRDVMLKGFDLTEASVMINILVLIFFAALMVVFGALTLRREIA